MTTKKKKKAAMRHPARRAIEASIGEPITFGLMLRDLRLCDEFTQGELARRVGVTTAHICDIEKGRKSVSLKRAAQFARALGYSERIFVEIALKEQLKQANLSYEIELKAA